MLFYLKIEILDRIIKVINGLFRLMVRLLKHEAYDLNKMVLSRHDGVISV